MLPLSASLRLLANASSSPFSIADRCQRGAIGKQCIDEQWKKSFWIYVDIAKSCICVSSWQTGTCICSDNSIGVLNEWGHLPAQRYVTGTAFFKQEQCIQRAEWLSRQWSQNGQLWVQAVSSSPATRAEVQDLLQRFTEELQIRQVRCISIKLQGSRTAVLAGLTHKTDHRSSA